MMTTPARVFLIVSAIVFGGGISSSMVDAFAILDEESISFARAVVGFFAAVFISMPMWLPAVIPNRFPGALAISKYICAAILAWPAYFFSTILTHNADRYYRGLEISPSAIFYGSLLTGLCIVCIVVLLWFDLRLYTKRDQQ